MLRLQGARKCPGGSTSRDIQEPAAVDEALAPFRRQVEESRITDDQLGYFIRGSSRRGLAG